MFSSGLFLLNPFAGVLFLLHLLFSNLHIPRKKLTNLFIICISFLLSFINFTKIPENDLIHYTIEYMVVSEYSFSDYLIQYGKEPLYFVFNYIIFYLSNGSVKFWLIAVTFISYFFFLTAVKKFFYKIEGYKYQLVFGLAIAAFFPQLFSLTAHLIRQCIAASIFVFFAVDYLFYKNNKWWLPIIGVLFHASSLLLFPLVYFKFLGDFKKYRIINIVVIALLLSYQEIASVLDSLIGGKNTTIDYILSRAISDTTHDLGKFPVVNLVMMIFMVFVVVSRKKIEQKEEHNKNKFLEVNLGMNRFFFMMVFLSLFIVANLHQSELSNRLFFYLFFFFPFVFPLFIAKFKQGAIISYLFAVLFILFFIYRLEYGVWTYAPLNELLTSSTFSFIFSIEPGNL